MHLTDHFSHGGRSLFTELERLIDAIDHATPSTATTAQGLDLWANDDALHVVLDAPGLDPASIDCSVLGDNLTIHGTASTTAAPTTVLRRERSSGTIARTVHLPYAVDGEHAEAHYRDGVLAITLHRRAGSKPQRIAVQAA